MAVLDPTSPTEQSISSMPYREPLPSDDHVFPLTWYAVMQAKALTTKPIKRTLLGKDVVLYRDHKGHVRCLEAYCSHRGADLSLGKCVDDQIHCVYHGWAFDQDGQCRSIPAHPDRPIPDFAHIVAYPTQERVGLIWIYPEDKRLASPPDLEVFPELEDANFTLSFYEAKWQAHLTRVVESVLDIAHLAFVHKKTIGRRLQPEIKQVRFSVPTSDRIIIENGGGLLDYVFPGQWILKAATGKSAFINYVTFTPISSHETLIFGYAGRSFLRKMPLMNWLFSKQSSKILEEDRLVVESQHPRPIPQALQMEAHVPADGPQVRFRQRWYQFLAFEEKRIMTKE